MLLRVAIDLAGRGQQDARLTRFAIPSILMVPSTLVLMVFTGLYW